MESKCLSRSEYRLLIIRMIDGREVDEELGDELINIIDRASNYWDVNIVGVNYLLAIIIEQLMKKTFIEKDFLCAVYKIQELMFFTVDELDYKFVNELFVNNLPEKRNFYIETLEDAKRANDFIKIAKIEQLKAQSFEEDLVRIIELYYESEIYR